MPGKPILAGLVIATAVTSIVEAASLRCNGDLIQPGDGILAVKRACGEPAREQKMENKFGAKIGTALYYEGDYGQSDRKVILVDGKVDRIELLD